MGTYKEKFLRFERGASAQCSQWVAHIVEAADWERVGGTFHCDGFSTDIQLAPDPRRIDGWATVFHSTSPARRERAVEAGSPPDRPGAGTSAFLTERIGAFFEPMDADLNRELGRKRHAGGVYVRSVEPNSMASRAGLLATDVILKVDHRDVSAPADIADAVRSAGREFVPLLVERGGKNRGMSLEQP